MIHIIYMAAGNSKRFGENKLLHNFAEKPLYMHGLDTICDFLKDSFDLAISLTVVTQYKEILDEINSRNLNTQCDNFCLKQQTDSSNQIDSKKNNFKKIQNQLCV